MTARCRSMLKSLIAPACTSFTSFLPNGIRLDGRRWLVLKYG
jgi:hypothetical protein